MRSNRLFAIAAVICLAAVAAVSAFADRVVAAVRHGFDRVLCALVEPFKIQHETPGQEKPRVALVAAKAFVLRLLKRRPTVHPSWVMCPSI